jgi:predicted DNA-binding transcriptional regulator AlpA
MSTAEAKRLLGLSGMTVWRWRKAGLLPQPSKIRGRNYWKRAEFLEALERLTQPTDAA